MSDNQTEQMALSLKVIKNSKDINLPAKPKILACKKSPKHQISEFLVKFSPLEFEKAQRMKGNQRTKSKEKPQQFDRKINENQLNQQKLNFEIKAKEIQKDIQNSDSLISSDNTSNLFYDHLNRSQSQLQSNPHKGSILSVDEMINRSENRSKSRSKLIRKQTVTQLSKNSQTKFSKSSTSPQFIVRNRFYHYCAQQIIKLSTQTDQIKAKIKNRHIQIDKIIQMNKDLEIKIEKQKDEMKNYHSLKQQLLGQRDSLKQQILACQVQIYSKLPERYKSEYRKHSQEQKLQMSVKMDQIKKQQEAIQSLRGQLNSFLEKQTKKKSIKAENQKLRQEIQRVKNKRILYDSKILKKNHIIKHLQEIKMVEYQNLLNVFNQ